MSSSRSSSSKPQADVGASVKKRVQQFDLHTALPKPEKPVLELEWDDIDTTDSAMLGRGSFSCVHNVGLQDAPGEIFALKQLNLSGSRVSAKQYKRGAIDIALEGKLISYLDHENIIKLHGVKKGCIQKSINDEEEPFFLVLDHLTETLDHRLEQWKRDENAISRLKVKMSGRDDKLLHRVETSALGIVKGMEYLHSLGVIFRDLKPENLGFDSNGTIKIFDFGVARDLQYVERVGDKLGFTGTPRYMANEVGAGKQYGLPADVYSFGILLHQICTLKQPYASLRNIEAFRTKVVHGGERPKLSLVKHTALRALIARCWDCDPEARPTFAEIRIELETILGHSQPEKRSTRRLSAKKQSGRPSLAKKLGDTTNVSSSSLYARRSSIESVHAKAPAQAA